MQCLLGRNTEIVRGASSFSLTESNKIIETTVTRDCQFGSSSAGMSWWKASRPRCECVPTKISDVRLTYVHLQVTDDLVEAGLESPNLIVGIDFTKSNEWTGKNSFNGRSLHHISSTSNLYEQVIYIFERTLALFAEDNSIHCFGFGDESTHDQDVFRFYHDGRPCNGFSEALGRYRELVSHVRLAGPTSFAPIIEMAMTIVKQNAGQHHTLLIIADVQVTRSVDTASGQLSAQERKTVEAIAEASGFPLSIVLVGVGDDMVQELDDKIPSRVFNNFHIVNFSEIMSKNMIQSTKEATFALSALMQIPEQYKAIVRLGILGPRYARSPYRLALLPPTGDQYTYSSESVLATKPGSSSSSSPREGPMHTSNPAMPSSTHDNQVCPICVVNPKDMAFDCGHRPAVTVDQGSRRVRSVALQSVLG